MINLLPPDIKAEYHFARRNRRLSRWAGTFMLGIAGLLALAVIGWFYMQHFADTYQKQVADAQQQLDNQHFDSVQKQVADISNNLKLVIQVLSREVLFSQLLDRLGTVTPSNVILTNLSIQQTTGGIDITAQTTDYNAATQLQVNLADPANQIFAKADIVNIICGTNTTNPRYPCTATIRALFAAKNPFLFINTTTKVVK